MIDFLSPEKSLKVDNNCEIKVIPSNRRRGLFEIYKKHFYQAGGVTFQWIRVKLIVNGEKKGLLTHLETINFIANYKNDRYDLEYKDYLFKKMYLARHKEEQEKEEYYFCPRERKEKK